MRGNVDPEQSNPSVPPPATPPSDPSLQATDSAGVAGDERTAEQVEAEWKFRLSQKDRAHQAAETVLQDQIATLERRLASKASPAEPGQAPSVEPEELTQLRRELASEKAQRVVAERKSKFPALAEFLGSGGDDMFANGTDVALAKLNSQFESGSSSTLIAPTAPRRGAPAAAKPLGEKSKEELLDDLKRLTPAYEAWAREQT